MSASPIATQPATQVTIPQGVSPWSVQAAPPFKWFTTTHILIAVNCLIFAAMLAYSIHKTGLEKFMNMPIFARFDKAMLFQWGANHAWHSFTGQYWRLITSIFIHGDFAHLAGNMLFLWALGRRLDRIFGNAKAFVIFMLTGIGSSLLSANWDTTALSFGASGAVYGQAGVLICLLIFGNLDFSYRDKRALTIWLILLTPDMFLTPAGVLLGHLPKEVDNAGHLGGLVSGLVLGGILAWTLRSPQPRRAALQFRTLAFASLALATLLALTIGIRIDMIRQYHQELALEKEWTTDFWAAMIVERQRVVSQKPNDAKAHAVLADAYSAKHRFEDAVAEYRRALEIAPGNPSFQYQLALTYLSMGRPRDAAPLFRESKAHGYTASDMEREHAATFREYAATLMIAREFEAAEKMLRQALALDSKSRAAHEMLAQVLEQLGKKTEAEQERKLAEQLPPSD